MDIRVDQYIEKHSNFSEKLTILREILLSTELIETVKWGMPTYTITDKNVIGIGSFKAHYGLWFFQGGLLKNKHNVLTNAQEGKTKAMRQWRFTKTSILDKKLLLQYIQEAISNQKKGLQISFSKKKKPLIIPSELKLALDKDLKLSKLYTILSVSKQREFADYISQAKREDTKTNRLEKIIPMILNGIGLNDKYRNC